MMELSRSPSVTFDRHFSHVDVQQVKATNSFWTNRPRNYSQESDDVTETIGPFCSEVFLGGSCNPTEWRKDKAIPALKEAQVTFYNPQVEHWSNDLVQLEQQAKDNARVLLFVHDKETRSLASMVEVGERAGLKKQKLILAMEGLSPTVADEPLTARELKELHRARNYTRDLAEVSQFPVYDDINSAVQACISQVKGNFIKERVSTDCDRTLGEKFIKMRNAFEMYATFDKLSKDERNLAFRVLHGREIPKEINMEDKMHISDTEFAMINSEHRMNSAKSSTRCIPYVHNMFHRRSSAIEYNTPVHKEVFICGPVGDFDWKKQIAQPIFEKAQVFVRDRSDDKAEHLMPMEMEQIEKCRVLLFVIPKDTWGVVEMIMAAYYIALGKTVVLCLQSVHEDTPVYGESLTVNQVKDYNRCRNYLSAQVTRLGGTVYCDIAEAAAKAAELAKM